MNDLRHHNQPPPIEERTADMSQNPDYGKRVKACTEGMKYLSTGLCPGCDECGNILGIQADEIEDAIDAGLVWNEPSFSWGQCDLCGSQLGGDREVYHYVDEDDELCHGDSACTDCVMYLANGDVPEVES